MNHLFAGSMLAFVAMLKEWGVPLERAIRGLRVAYGSGSSINQGGVMLKELVEKLGFEARDRVTGMTGVITSVCVDLYGCKQVILTPKVDKDGKRGDAGWFDLNRIEVTGFDPVMVCPLLAAPETEKGGAEKPLT